MKTKNKNRDGNLEPIVNNVEANGDLPMIKSDDSIAVSDQKSDAAAPKEVSEKKRRGRGRYIQLKPGEIAKITVGEGDKAVEVPFSLPPEVLEETKISIGSANVGWIGREGNQLRIHICQSEVGAVIMMPQTDGSWKANAFTNNNVTVSRFDV